MTDYSQGMTKDEAIAQWIRRAEDYNGKHQLACIEIERLRKALQKIADLIDSEAGEPLDDAIKIASEALALVDQQEIQ
jgi:hypothetical protein